MPIHNADIAATFDEIADLLGVQGANPFRIRAYRNASRTLSGLREEAAGLLAKGEDLTALPGIGEDLAGKIAELVETGRCPLLDRLRKELPPGVAELLRIPGLGPKRAMALHHELDVHTIEQLHRAAKDGRIRSLPGFGLKTEQRILETLDARVSKERRFKLAVAASYADALVAYLKQAPGVGAVEVAGSFRRARETVGDLDILATAARGDPVMDWFTRYDEVKEVLSKGATRATVRLRSGLQVDLRVVPEKSYGSALLYFTGSTAHNIAIRRIGLARGLKINEYGVFKGPRWVSGTTEAEVYRTVDLPYIPPELREDQGEIEAARQGRLPRLVELGDLRGDLHSHTKATDGHDAIRDMALAAKNFGLSYFAITEHSRHLTVAHGLDAKRLAKQGEEIDRLNDQRLGIHILKGIEVDILEDGRLDLPDNALERLDLVVGAVHSNFRLSRARQTERILRAMDRPHFSILAHPSGRLIDEREPYDVDMPRIIRNARERGCAIELNAHPERLDLLDVHCRAAKDEGVPIAINSDAHSVRDFVNLRFGIGQARRGWLELGDVLNTRPLAALRAFLRRTM
jgi:DNA polymerase (family 10)